VTETVLPSPSAGAAQGRSGWGFRPDVEGLRAIAILAVVGYHAGLPFLPGGFIGVDVFFVISGFLITGLLVTEVTRTGRVDLARFWARRARRLLPAATLVLALTALVTWWVVPAIEHGTFGLDIVASAFYVANLRFAGQATDYLSEDAAPSPVLHFWSLGVEEQFYVVWPLLLVLLAAVLARRAAGRPSRRQVGIALAVLGLASFAWSWWLTGVSEPWAFFGMATRAWEFAVGGLLAVGAASVARLPAPARGVLGLVGLVALVASLVLIDEELPYPGTAALWPVLATGAIIAAGTTSSGRPAGVPALLATAPARAVGRISYSWYLWHWPVLVLAAWAWGELSLTTSVALALASLVPAVLAYRFVENPLRHRPSLVASSGASLRLGLVLSVAAAVAGLALTLLPGGGAAAAPVAVPAEGGGRPVAAPTTEPDDLAPEPSETAASPSASSTPSPASSPSPTPAPTRTPSWPDGPITPSPQQARADLPITYENGCHLDNQTSDGAACVFGDRDSATTVVLLGDSHAAQWFPALNRIAKEQGWRLLSRTKAGCPAPDVTIWQRSFSRAYTGCDAWRDEVLSDIERRPPALVVAAGTRTESLVDRSSGARLEGTGRSGDEWIAGWDRTLSRLGEAGVPVAVLRDTPWAGVDMAACVAGNASDPSRCDLPRSTLDSPAYDVRRAARAETATGVDLSDVLCGSKVCPATLGRYLVYRDTDHLTATFATALAPYLADRLVPLVR
jgi:peptidoglycan/LPS O-acetylase OafA/YrhL